jgi:hypothetical protein
MLLLLSFSFCVAAALLQLLWDAGAELLLLFCSRCIVAASV